MILAWCMCFFVCSVFVWCSFLLRRAAITGSKSRNFCSIWSILFPRNWSIWSSTTFLTLSECAFGRQHTRAFLVALALQSPLLHGTRRRAFLSLSLQKKRICSSLYFTAMNSTCAPSRMDTIFNAGLWTMDPKTLPKWVRILRIVFVCAFHQMCRRQSKQSPIRYARKRNHLHFSAPWDSHSPASQTTRSRLTTTTAAFWLCVRLTSIRWWIGSSVMKHSKFGPNQFYSLKKAWAVEQ